MHWHTRLNSSIVILVAILLCCEGTGCLFEGGYVMRRAWFDYNTLKTPAIFLDETHHLPLRSSRTDQLRWMYNQGPTQTYDEIGMKAYHEKQQGKSWRMMARRHFTGQVESETRTYGSSHPPVPQGERRSSEANPPWSPGFVPPAPTPLRESNRKNNLKKSNQPTLERVPQNDNKFQKPNLAPPLPSNRKKKKTAGPVA